MGTNTTTIRTKREGYDEGSYVVTRTVTDSETGRLVMSRDWTVVRSRLVVSSGSAWVVQQRGFRRTAVVNTLAEAEAKALVLRGTFA